MTEEEAPLLSERIRADERKRIAAWCHRQAIALAVVSRSEWNRVRAVIYKEIAAELRRAERSLAQVGDK